MNVLNLRMLCRLDSARKRLLSTRNFNFIPSEPTPLPKMVACNDVVITEENIFLLERLSLVDFGNRQGVQRLSEAIKFADSIKDVCTEGIEPLLTVQEGRSLQLRPDVVEPAPSVDDLLSCAALSEDDYFVAPPGNVPLEVINTYSTDDHARR